MKYVTRWSLLLAGIPAAFVPQVMAQIQPRGNSEEWWLLISHCWPFQR
ncbi:MULTISPECIES: hypothetical protein [Pseudomonas]|nr:MULTISPECIES: hypothetical protein [Pseudomonas]MCE5984322.1 hypothetical protein [Pseudomonas sp. LF19]